MSGWTPEQAEQLTGPQEVELATRRPDGSLRRPRTIWIVRDRDRVFIRSTNGRDADWFRYAISTLRGQIHAAGRSVDVTFTEAQEADASLADAGYQAKYGRAYSSIVRHLLEPGPRAATLEVQPE